MFKQSLKLVSKRLVYSFGENSASKLRFLSNTNRGLTCGTSTLQESLGNFNSCIFLSYRYYAKDKNIRKEKKKKSYINENELAEIFDIEKLMSEINKPLTCFKEELIEHTTPRTSQGAIENIKIHFENDTYKVQDLAEIGKPNPKFYVLDFASFPQVIPTVLSTFQKSELNINVQQEGTKIYVPIPKVTKEHRELLAKKAKVYFQKCKEAVREVQFKYVRKLKNTESLSQETMIRITDQLTALGDKHISMAEEILKVKQNDLLKTDQ